MYGLLVQVVGCIGQSLLIFVVIQVFESGVPLGVTERVEVPK